MSCSITSSILLCTPVSPGRPLRAIGGPWPCSWEGSRCSATSRRSWWSNERPGCGKDLLLNGGALSSRSSTASSAATFRCSSWRLPSSGVWTGSSPWPRLARTSSGPCWPSSSDPRTRPPTSKTTTRLTLVLLLLGGALLSGLVLHLGLATLAGEIQKLGWNLIWVMLPSIGVYVLDALGWRSTLGRHAEKIRFDRLFMTRMAGEAVNFTTPAAYLGGEPMKAYLLSRHNVPLVDGMASVVTAKTTMTLAEVVFILLGVGLGAVRLSRPTDVLVPSLLGLGLLGFAVGLFLTVQRFGMFMGLLRALNRVGVRIAWLKARERKLEALDDAIRAFYGRDRRGFLL